MLSNALLMLVHVTRRATKHPDAPVFYLMQSGTDLYQVIVQRVPDSKQAVG